uniref:Uncharacterized protein n=1 Tax=Daphnia magna TaxID=35525 RepID=A0A0N8ELS2_9CRUS
MAKNIEATTQNYLSFPLMLFCSFALLSRSDCKRTYRHSRKRVLVSENPHSDTQ